jgi:hypothetical protein
MSILSEWRELNAELAALEERLRAALLDAREQGEAYEATAPSRGPRRDFFGESGFPDYQLGGNPTIPDYGGFFGEGF